MNEDTTMSSGEFIGSAGVPRPKIREPEVFKGERTALGVESWIGSLDLYFKLVKISHGQEQLWYALSLLRGDAQLWYNQLKMYEPAFALPQDWEDLKRLVRKEFIPINAVIQARDKLASLVQRGSVTEYINEFRRLKLQIPDLSKGDALDRFVRGLKKPIRVAVRSRFPETISNAESLALAIEAAALEGGASDMVEPAQAPVAPNYDPMDLDSLRSLVNALAGQVQQQNDRGRGGRYGGSRRGANGGSFGGGSAGPRCFGCGGYGHLKRECPTYLNKTNQGRSNNGNRSLGHLKD